MLGASSLGGVGGGGQYSSAAEARSSAAIGDIGQRLDGGAAYGARGFTNNVAMGGSKQAINEPVGVAGQLGTLGVIASLVAGVWLLKKFS